MMGIKKSDNEERLFLMKNRTTIALTLCLAASLACSRGTPSETASPVFTPSGVQAAVEKGMADWQQRGLEKLAASMATTDSERQQVVEVLREHVISRETGGPRIVSIDGTGEEETAMVCALCPQLNLGCLPTFFECKAVDGRLEAHVLQEPGNSLSTRNGSVADYTLALIRGQMENWRAVQSPALSAKTEALKKRLAAEIAAIQMADREGLRIVPGYATEEAISRKLAMLEKLSPEDIRARELEELDAALKALESR